MKKIKDDYFLDVDDEMLNFLEHESEKCITHLNSEINKKKESAYKALKFLGVGAALCVFLTLQQRIDQLTISALNFSLFVWLFCIILLIQFCIKSRLKPAMGNSPLGLYSQYYKDSDSKNKLDVLRRYNLSTTEDVIAMLIKENNRIANWLNIIFYLSALPPAFYFLNYVLH